MVSLLSGRKDVKAVLDPTMLVDANDWKRLEEPFLCNSKFIFVYIPNGINDALKEYINEAKQIYKVDEVKILYTRGNKNQLDYKQIKFVSVGQFIYLINHAEAIVTSSFHAAVFSIIFHKEFWCYDVPNNLRGEDYRLYDLLSQFDLTNRLITNENGFSIDKKIDYNEVDRILAEKQDQSLEYLTHALT